MYDLIVIGGGPGGHAAAEAASHQGAKVCIIERAGWGGTCTQRGCIPTKALLTCSGHFAALKRFKRLGIGTAPASFDFAAMKRHQEQIVRISALGVRKSLEEAGVVLKEGTGRLLAPGEVAFATEDGVTEILPAKRICIAWGSEPLLLPGITPSARVLTSDGLLQMTQLPESLLIVGGSVIGVEFATLFAELGCRVTIVELLEQLIPTEDRDAADYLAEELKKRGVQIHTATRMTALTETAGGIVITAATATKDQPIELKGQYALFATGRKPRLEEGELAQTGIVHTPNGIVVDEHQRTNLGGVYAVGDVTGGMMLAHRAMQQGRALADHLFGDSAVICNESAVPAVIYTHPQIARVGLTEREAQNRGLSITVQKAEYAANIMARAELVPTGFVKRLFHRGKLIGAVVAGEMACELIAPFSLAVSAGLGEKELANWILPHPTLSEILRV